MPMARMERHKSLGLFEHMYSGQAQQEDLLSSLNQSVATVAATD